LPKNFISIFLIIPIHFLVLKGQDQQSFAFANNVLQENTFEKQQDRHIALNDSLDKLALYKKQFDYLCQIYKRSAESGNKKLQATVMISIGNFQISASNYAAAIDTFNKAVKMYEALNEIGGVSTAHANMGNTYFYLRDLDKALYYYKISISDLKKSKTKPANMESRLANCYNSLGSIYCSKKDFVFGRTYFDLAYNIWRKNGDSLSISYIFNNYAEIFFESKKMDSAFLYFNKALQLKLRYGDAYDKADAHNNLSDYYSKTGKPKESIVYAYKALNYLDTTIYSRTLIITYWLLTEEYSKLKDYKNELKYYKKYKAANDSSDVQGQNSELSRKDLRNEFDKIHLADSIKSVEEIKLKDLKISAKNTQGYFLIFILLLTIVALSLIYSRFQLTKKQKVIIEQKNKEITDSINYAKKIQQSILPTEKYLDKEIKRLRDKK
jgi:tetratricopeptide (TPR) repeat protein